MMNLYIGTVSLVIHQWTLTRESLGCRAPPFSSCVLTKEITCWKVWRFFTATFFTFKIPALPTALREISILSNELVRISWIRYLYHFLQRNRFPIFSSILPLVFKLIIEIQLNSQALIITRKSNILIKIYLRI